MGEYFTAEKTNLLEDIHNSLVNGQKKQMVEQIKEHGVYDFFSEYKIYLLDLYCEHTAFKYFSDAVISFHRIEK
jgi:hypothetical protein